MWSSTASTMSPPPVVHLSTPPAIWRCAAPTMDSLGLYTQKCVRFFSHSSLPLLLGKGFHPFPTFPQLRLRKPPSSFPKPFRFEILSKHNYIKRNPYGEVPFYVAEPTGGDYNFLCSVTRLFLCTQIIFITFIMFIHSFFVLIIN